MFWKKTKADKITQKEQDAFIDYIRNDFGFSDDELADFTNWLMIARYEGRVADDLPVCASLKNRYKDCVFNTRKDTKTKTPLYLKQMRYDILMNCDFDFVSPVFVRLLESKIGGKTKANINARFAA